MGQCNQGRPGLCRRHFKQMLQQGASLVCHLPWAHGDGALLNPHPPLILDPDLVKSTCMHAGVE